VLPHHPPFAHCTVLLLVGCQNMCAFQLPGRSVSSEVSDAVDPWASKSNRPFKLQLECDVQNVAASIVPIITAPMLLQGPEGAAQLVEPRFDNEIRCGRAHGVVGVCIGRAWGRG
jgi:hypothetical protein